VEFCCADTDRGCYCVLLFSPRDVPKINMDQRAGHVASGGVARRLKEQSGRVADCVGKKLKLDRGAASAMTEQI